MVFITRSIGQITEDALVVLQTNTNITKLTPGGKARAILDIVSQVIKGTYSEIDVALAKGFISASNGQFLDLFGILLGEPRLVSEVAGVETDMQTVKFYVATGTFGSINGNNAITIPRGTILSTGDGATGTTYRIKSEVTLASAASSAWVSCEATTTGSESNVGTGSLIYHDFISYTDQANKSLLVTNIYPIGNGKDYEEDSNYKYRLTVKVTAAEAANEVALRLAALSTPGVADVIMKKHYRGIGTFGIIVKSVAPIASTGLIDAVTQRIMVKQGYGSVAFVRPQLEVGFALKTRVWYRKTLTNDEFDLIETTMESTVRDYINSLDLNEPLLVDRMISSLYDISSAIEGFGTRTTALDESWVYMPTLLQDNRISRKLIGNYIPRTEEERVVIEPTVANPVIFDRKLGSRPT